MEPSKIHALPIAIIIILSVILISLSQTILKDKISTNRALAMAEFMLDIAPENLAQQDLKDLINSSFIISSKNHDPQHAFRIIQHDAQTGIILFPIVAKGYKGSIELAVGIMRNGTITGVRTYRHNETKGIGDGIDLAVSDWITQFQGRSLENTTWGISSDNNGFDGLSGATITSRAVIKKVEQTLLYHDEQKQIIYPKNGPLSVDHNGSTNHHKIK